MCRGLIITSKNTADKYMCEYLLTVTPRQIHFEPPIPLFFFHTTAAAAAVSVFIFFPHFLYKT